MLIRRQLKQGDGGGSVIPDTAHHNGNGGADATDGVDGLGNHTIPPIGVLLLQYLIQQLERQNVAVGLEPLGELVPEGDEPCLKCRILKEVRGCIALSGL